MTSSFKLHPQLQNDTTSLGHFELCRLLLMQESRYPWLILVPERAGLSEIYQMDEVDQIQMFRESACVAKVLVDCFKPEKLNIATIGNLVPQLHVHHIARFREDAAWPLPVWGKFAPEPYSSEALAERLELLRKRLPKNFTWT